MTNMLRSKSRSGSVDLGKKNHYSSVFSRTISASKLCRGDGIGSQIDINALKSVEKTPSNLSNIPESRIGRVVSMQQQMGELEEELKRTKERLSVTELEKDLVLDQLKGAKEEANMRLNEVFSPKKARELMAEIENLKSFLFSSQEESKIKDKKIQSLESELEKAGRDELALAENAVSMEKLKEDLRILREKEKNMMVVLSENKKRIQELEGEVEEKKQAESKMADSLVIQNKQFETTKTELEESKAQIASLSDKIESLDELSKRNGREIDGFDSKDKDNQSNEEIKGLKLELQMTKENLDKVQESEKKVSSKVSSLLDEIDLLKNELKMAIEAEEKSRNAMEDLALALTEVATEANHAKENVIITQNELEQVKGEAEQLKAMVRGIEERYKKLLNEAKQEAELHKNTAVRLRLEAEETLLAWNGKEMGFVSCIKRAEEERAIAQHESKKLGESLNAAENMTRAAREEAYKLRDILKQAVNESNAAKAAAGIARDENSLLKDCLAEKEETLHFLTRENERLRIDEAAAHENVKEFKRLLSRGRPESKNEENGIMVKSLDTVDEKGLRNDDMKKTFSFNFEDLKFMNEPEDSNNKVQHEDSEKAEALKGSIFDTNAETPKSVSNSHQRGHSSPFKSGAGTPNSDDFDFDFDSDGERNPERRMRSMFRRVGAMLSMKRSDHHRRESSTE